MKLTGVKNKGVELFRQLNLPGIMSGSVLSHPLFLGQRNYVLFVAFIAFVYITNHYDVERKLIEASVLAKENQELRSESISTSSELMNMSKQSEVYRRLKQMGSELEMNATPPRKLRVN